MDVVYQFFNTIVESGKSICETIRQMYHANPVLVIIVSSLLAVAIASFYIFMSKRKHSTKEKKENNINNDNDIDKKVVNL